MYGLATAFGAAAAAFAMATAVRLHFNNPWPSHLAGAGLICLALAGFLGEFHAIAAGQEYYARFAGIDLTGLSDRLAEVISTSRSEALRQASPGWTTWIPHSAMLLLGLQQLTVAALVWRRRSRAAAPTPSTGTSA